jgi:acyl-CoA thioesterase YciA
MPPGYEPAGDIFGGWLMARMDLAAGNAAARRARGRCVTFAVDGMVFHTPIHVGDEVSVYADLISTGRTPMRFQVEAWCSSRDGGEGIKVTEAVVTFVAIDSGSRPRPLPPGLVHKSVNCGRSVVCQGQPFGFSIVALGISCGP